MQQARLTEPQRPNYITWTHATINFQVFVSWNYWFELITGFLCFVLIPQNGEHAHAKTFHDIFSCNKINAAAMALASDLCNMDELCATSGLHLRGRITGCRLVGRMATTRRFGHSTPGSDRTRSLSLRCFHPEDSPREAQFPGLGHWCRGVSVEHPFRGGGCHLRFSSHQFAKLFFDR